jgi:phage regulator Rha-like protein
MNKHQYELIPIEHLEKSIYLIRGEKVMLDEDLARLYQVRTKALVQAVKRNIDRFPIDFMFQLTSEEYSLLRSQIVTSSGRTGRRTPPFAFTEHGIAMLSSVLGSERAVQVNIAIIRAFVRMRQLLASHKDLAKKLDDLERRYDAQFKVVFNSIRQLIAAQPKLSVHVRKKSKIGFGRDDE